MFFGTLLKLRNRLDYNYWSEKPSHILMARKSGLEYNLSLLFQRISQLNESDDRREEFKEKFLLYRKQLKVINFILYQRIKSAEQFTFGTTSEEIAKEEQKQEEKRRNEMQKEREKQDKDNIHEGVKKALNEHG
jgi:hypothetical protein